MKTTKIMDTGAAVWVVPVVQTPSGRIVLQMRDKHVTAAQLGGQLLARRS
jgi:hypothetical protein